MKNLKFIVYMFFSFQNFELIQASEDETYKLHTIADQNMHAISKRMYVCNVFYNDTTLTDTGVAESDEESIESPFLKVEQENIDDVLKHVTIFLSNKEMTNLLDQVNCLLTKNCKTIIFTLGKNVSIIGEHQLEKLKPLKESDLPLLANAIHIVLNKEALETSWVYTIQGLRTLEIQPEVKIDCFLLKPDRQQPFMVLAHEWLHIIQDLNGEKASATSQSEIYPYLDECSINGFDMDRIKILTSSLWTQSSEVGVIVGLPSYDSNRVTELSLRRELSLPPRIFHSGGIGTPPEEGAYVFCDTLPMIERSFFEPLPALISHSEMKAMQRLMNWLDGKTESPMTDSNKPTPMVSSSDGDYSGENSARREAIEDWQGNDTVTHGGQNDTQ